MISVCLLTFNGEKYITQQISSILSQLGSDDELIVSDDCSSDNTLAKIDLIKDTRIKVFRNIEKKSSSYYGVFKNTYNISRNCENALKIAAGDYIFLSDQDDVWSYNKVNTVMLELTSCDMVIHNCSVVDEDMNIISDNYFLKTPPKTTFFGLLIKSSFMGCCMAFNRKIRDLSLPFPENEIEHDAWLGINAIKYGNIKVINETLIYYRRHSGNISFCSQKSTNKFKIKLWRRFVLIKNYYLA